MRTTLTLTVDEEMARFINEQPGLVDTSALINKLIHEDMMRKGITVDPAIKAKLQQDDVLQTLELYADENTHAAG
ncbi:MAG: hypothetical protein K0Q50_1779 [Vampirovibrio sp.]|jgi:hypothetical protein|nr:hypothetical protein [Vampirovibrio sp.]